ncbi:MAG: OmpH family outer membrane protein [Gemmatimonadota bacterium]
MSFTRRLVVLSVVLLVAGAGRATAQQAPPTGTTFVYLRSAEILQQVPGYADAQRTFQREFSAWQAELSQQSAEVDSLTQDYQRQEVMLSPQARQQKQQELRDKQQALSKRVSELDNQAKARQQELVKPILERASAVIEQIRTEQGYSMIFDISTEGVVSADPSLDITQLVIDRLKSSAPAAAADSAASP